MSLTAVHSCDFPCRADESLYEMERNPNMATQVIWQASRSPVGEAAAAGVRGAAELTLSAGAFQAL